MLPNEKHEFSTGWPVAQQGGTAGCNRSGPGQWAAHLRRAGGLDIKLGCRKRQAGGLLFSAACSALFRSPPFCAARRPAESSRFSFGNTPSSPTAYN